jgi:hypothetical protein
LTESRKEHVVVLQSKPPIEREDFEELKRECAAYLEALGNLVDGDPSVVKTEVCSGDVALRVAELPDVCAAAAVVAGTHTPAPYRHDRFRAASPRTSCATPARQVC